MFGTEAPKQRKITTYGKASRSKQQAYSFTNLQNSPEKPKIEAATYNNVKATPVPRVVSPSDGPRSLQKSTLVQEDTTWDVPSDDDEPEGHAIPTKSLPTKPAAFKSRPATAVASQLKRREVKPQQALMAKSVEVDDLEAMRQRKRAARSNLIMNSYDAPTKTKEKDIFEFPDDGGVVVLQARPTKSSTKPQQRTPAKSSTKTTTMASRPRQQVRASTPEVLTHRQTPITVWRTTGMPDVYDFPEDESEVTRKHPMVVIDSPRKRQKTPTRAAASETKATHKVKSRAVSTATMQALAMSSRTPPPKIANARRKHTALSPNVSSNGVAKRKLNKGSSAPASLFSMIREPPSPPTDSSDSATSPATPEMSSEMDLDPSPSTPRSRSTVSPSAMGSVTPRQKQLWGQLLGGDAADSPSDLPIAKLRLSSNVKTASKKISSLTRSSSDVPRSTYSRRPRLIDSLKASAPLIEEDEMEVDDQSEASSVASGEDTALPVEEAPAEPPKLRTEISSRSTNSKVTYGQGRTFLEEKNEDIMWEMLAEEPSQPTSGFGSQSQDASTDDTEMEGTSQLRAAHDLRVAGSRKRFHDQLSMLVMDLEQTNHSASIRRVALRELAVALTDKEAAACFLESGLDRSFLASVENDTDTVSLFLEAAVIFLLVGAEPTSTILDHIFNSKMFANLLKLLDVSQDLNRVVRDRKSNLTKITQTMMLEYRDTLLESTLWGPTKPRALTPRVLGLQCIEMVVRQLREHGNRSSLLADPTMKKVIDIARAEVNGNVPDLAILECALSALHASTAASSVTSQQKMWPEALIETFGEMLPTIIALPEVSAHTCIQVSLSIAMELSNHDPVACDVIGTPRVITLLFQNANRRYARLLAGLEGEGFMMVLGLTVLTFGLTTNLTGSSDAARLAVLNSGQDLLNESIRLFIQGKKRAEDAESLEDSQTNVIYGYLALSLGNLTRNAILRRKIGNQLPGGKLTLVLDAMQDFLQINLLTDKEGEESHESHRTFTKRMQTAVEEVRKLNT